MGSEAEEDVELAVVAFRLCVLGFAGSFSGFRFVSDCSQKTEEMVEDSEKWGCNQLRIHGKIDCNKGLVLRKTSSVRWKAIHSCHLLAKVLSGFLRWKAGVTAPFYATYMVSGRCNLRCAFCGWWKSKVNELSTQEALIAIDEVCRLGIPFFHFAGGEPMLREDLSLLAERASSHGCMIGMSTNGTLFNSFNVSKIAGSFDTVCVSLDGPREVHDKYRGIEATFDKAVGGIRLLKAEGVKVGVNTIITPWNIGILQEFVEWLYGFVDFAMLQPIHPYPPPAQNRPSAGALSDLIAFLVEFKREHPRFLALPVGFIRGFEGFFEGGCPKICDAGKLYVAIDPMGRLLACASRTDIVLGSVLERSAADILSDKLRNPEWLKVITCEGCWLECSTQPSMTIREPLKEVISLSGVAF